MNMARLLIPQDKANHYVYGQGIFALSFAALCLPWLALGFWAKIGLAIGVVSLFAIGKEIRDKRTGKGTPEWRDALWTEAGVVVPTIVLALAI